VSFANLKGAGQAMPFIHTSGTPGATCNMAMWNHIASTITIFLLVANPPTGALMWMAMATVSGYAYTQTAYSVSQSCNGVHGARTGNLHPCPWARKNYSWPYYRWVEVHCYNP
jgi:hypothetical protein